MKPARQRQIWVFHENGVQVFRPVHSPEFCREFTPAAVDPRCPGCLYDRLEEQILAMYRPEIVIDEVPKEDNSNGAA